MSRLVWQTLEAKIASGVLFNRIVLPLFSFTGLPWLGASFIVTEFPIKTLVGQKYFSFRFPITPPDDVNFCLAIRWLDEADNVHRRKLWQNISESLDYPLYMGETIKFEPTLEIWTVEASSEASLEGVFTLISGITSQPTSCCQNSRDNFNDLNAPEHSELFRYYGLLNF